MKKKKTPERTCVGCREKKPKKELMRIVRTPAGEVVWDPTGKASGRGTYLCADLNCLEKAIRSKAIEKALERPLAETTVWHLKQALSKEK